MRRQHAGPRFPRLVIAIACLGAGLPVLAQSPPPPAPSRAVVQGGPASEARLEAEVRELKARIADLARQVERLAPRSAPAPAPAPAATADGERPSSPAQEPQWGPPAPVPDLPAGVRFGPGFELKSLDEEFSLQFHDLTQLDGRFFQQGGQTPVHDTFTIPREWLIFSGRLTKPYEYLVALAHGFTSVVLLDAYLNIHFDDRLQFKVGRFFAPFTYEPYKLPIYALITPEWSMFFHNFEPNRENGAMVWGQLAGQRVEYAAGVFNGTRNALLDTNDGKDFIGFLNTKPFSGAGVPALENLNVGGSVNLGTESNLPNPPTLSTVVSLPGNPTIGVPFLTFNSNARESGVRALWSLHLAYYHRQLSLIAEWDGGFEDYALAGGPARTRLPLRSGFIEAGYFLTGETVASRGVVVPRRPFDLRKGKFGLGAWELAGRYNWLDLGAEVFTNGLADPNLWTNQVATRDIGLNWYWNRYVKLALFWEHAEFGSPVLYRPGARQLTSDLFLVRAQLRY